MHAISLEWMAAQGADRTLERTKPMIKMRCPACRANGPRSAQAVVAVKSALEHCAARSAYWICAGCNDFVGAPIGWLRLAWFTCHACGVSGPSEVSKVRSETAFTPTPSVWDLSVGLLPYTALMPYIGPFRWLAVTV